MTWDQIIYLSLYAFIMCLWGLESLAMWFWIKRRENGTQDPKTTNANNTAHSKPEPFGKNLFTTTELRGQNLNGLKTTPKSKAEALKIRESAVEKYLKDRAVARGGRTWKWTGGNGVPDRIIMLNGNIAFCEVKRPYATPRESQLAQHAKMARCGVPTYVVDRYEMVDELLDLMSRHKGNGGIKC